MTAVRAAIPPGPLPPGRDRCVLVGEVARALGDVPTGAAVVVACSGGPDSVALAHLTAEARPDLRPTLAHVRHGLRDDHSDVAVVRTHARWLGVPLEVVEVTVTGAGDGLQAAARRARYRALDAIVERAGADALIVGHTADDQAETVLLRLARGTGPTGLVGMTRRRGVVVRPMLRLRRDDLHRYVHSDGLPAVDDPANRDRAHRRARARHDVLPALTRLGPDPVGALGRLADLVRADVEALERAADDVRHGLATRYGDAVVVRRRGLVAAGPALAPRVLRDLVVAARPGGYPPSASQVHAILTLRSGALYDLGGVRVGRTGPWLALAPRDPGAGTSAAPLRPGGPVAWPPAACWVEARIPTGGASAQLTLTADLGQPARAVAPHPDAAIPPGGAARWSHAVVGGLDERERADLVVRSRRPGDRIVLAGGTRKLQDVMVDARVPRLIRDRIPVVATTDRVLFVPGLGVDDHARRAGRVAPQLEVEAVRRGPPR